MTPENTPSMAAAPPSTSVLERRNWTIAELAAAQAVAGPQDFDAIFGAGADLWDDDAEFEAFMAALRESRRTGG